jgi:predicted HAD superfamily hydrolase
LERLKTFESQKKIKSIYVCSCDHYSRAETNQGRKLLISRRFLLRKLFKGGNYSRAETIRGNTVYEIFKVLKIQKRIVSVETIGRNTVPELF